MSKPKIPCMILCGGKSRRFEGGRKEFAKLNNQSLMFHVLSRLKDQCGPLAINGVGGRNYEFYKLPVIRDKIGGQLGPLAGIYTAMIWARRYGFDRVLTCSNDTPFIPLNWVERLVEARTSGIAVSRSNGRNHYSSALWPTNLAPSLEKDLRNGQREVGKWMKKHDYTSVDFEIEDGIDPFFNINTNEDLKMAEQMLQGLIRP